MTTEILFIFLLPLSIVMLANALMVNNNQAMKVSIFIAGLGVLGVSVYGGLRAAGLIEPSAPIFIITLIVTGIGLYSVFGAPLFLEIVKRREQ